MILESGVLARRGPDRYWIKVDRNLGEPPHVFGGCARPYEGRRRGEGGAKAGGVPNSEGEGVNTRNLVD